MATINTSSLFKHALPPERLGKRHDTLDSFYRSVKRLDADEETLAKRDGRKEYTLVVVTESPSSAAAATSKRRILLGLKRRGFGAGFYNSFGGHLEPSDDSPAHGAARELREETNIVIPIKLMQKGHVGVLTSTFHDDVEQEMVVHLFRVDVACSDPLDGSHARAQHKRIQDMGKIEPETIKGGDEITPKWFEDWHEAPLNNMFADDSVWLPIVLSEPVGSVKFDGWFHFCPGGTETNSIMHHHMRFDEANSRIRKSPENAKRAVSLEWRLLHSLHVSGVKSPSIKEFKECWAFANGVRSYFGSDAYDFVLDVAGGHGALAALFLILTTAERATVIDPAVLVRTEKRGVRHAWSSHLSQKSLEYRHECLRTALPDEISALLTKGGISPNRVLVVACHACQHLTDETIRICESYGVHVAVMPCCQKDHGGSWKAVARHAATNGLGIGFVMDLLAAGKMMAPTAGRDAGVCYKVKMKVIDERITPQNRLILCKARPMNGKDHGVEGTLGRNFGVPSSPIIERAHTKLQKAYARAHKLAVTEQKNKHSFCFTSAAIGLCTGILLSFVIQCLR